MCTGTPDVSASVAAVCPQDVQAAGRDARRLPMFAEPLREPLRVDVATEFVGEHEVAVLVGGAGEVAFEQLRLAVGAQRIHGHLVQRDPAP